MPTGLITGLGNPLTTLSRGGGVELITLSVTGTALPGWLVYNGATTAYATPNAIAGATGPSLAALSGPQQSISATVAPVTATYTSVAFSPNGEFVIAYVDGTNGSNPRFARYNAAGALQGAIATIASVSATYTSVAFSPNGEFVVAYVDGTNGGNPRFARYSAAGVLQGAITTIAAVTSAYTDVAFSPNGEFVVAYAGASNNPTFARYSATGVLQGAITTIAAVTSAYTAVAFSPTGQFVVAYQNLTNAGNPTFARYSATGVLQGAITTIDTVVSSYTSVAFSPNGQFVVAYADEAIGPRFARYNAAGALQGAITTIASGFVATFVSVAYSPNGEFSVVYRTDAANGAVARFARYSSAGALQGSITTVAPIASTYSDIAFSLGGESVIAHVLSVVPSFVGYTYPFANSNYVVAGVAVASSVGIAGTTVSVVCSGFPTTQNFNIDFRAVGGVAIGYGAVK